MFPVASVLSVTWRLLRDDYLKTLDKRFCSVPDTVMGRHIFLSLFRIEIDVVQAGKQNRSLFVKFPLYKERSANNLPVKSVSLYIFYPFAMVIQK